MLPKVVKDILLRPCDEDSWGKLEELRKAIAREVEGEELVYLATNEEVDVLALAIESCERTHFVDEVGAGSKLPEGARVIVDGAPTKADVATAVRGMANTDVNTFMRPFGTCRAPSSIPSVDAWLES